MNLKYYIKMAETIDKLKEENYEFIKDNYNLKEKIDSIRDEFDRNLTVNSELIKLNVDFIEQNHDLKERLKDQHEVLEELFHENKELEAEIEMFKVEKNELEIIESLFRLNLKNAENKIIDLETKNNQFLNDKLILRKHLDKNVDHSNKLHKKNNELVIYNEHSLKIIDDLTDYIVELEGELEEERFGEKGIFLCELN